MAAARPSTRPRRGESADAVLRRLLAEQFAEVTANEPRARKGSVQGLHDIRVALRRMRTLTVTFAELDPVFLSWLDKRAAKVCDRMGDARDLDVWIELFGELEKAGGLEAMPSRERRAVRRAVLCARATALVLCAALAAEPESVVWFLPLAHGYISARMFLS